MTGFQRTEISVASRRERLQRAPDLGDLEYNPAALRKLLKECGITQAKAAELVGTHRSTVERWASGPDTVGHRACPPAAWHLLLLRLDKHPVWLLEIKAGIDRDDD